MKRLLLFDLDGTLVRSRGFGRRALDEVFAELYGWEDATAAVNFAGATDPLIVRQVFEHHDRGADEAAAAQEGIFAGYVERLARLAEARPDACASLPGARGLLDVLGRRDDCVLGVLTGNVEGGARIKLEVAGLGAFYRVGAFGDEAPTRNDLLPVAVRRAGGLGYQVDPADAVVIGDTPRDVAVARAHGARAVAVATGSLDREALGAHAPDALLDDLVDVTASITAILG